MISMVLDADTSATRGIVMTDPSIAPARTPAEVDAIVDALDREAPDAPAASPRAVASA